jgi:hypothetical protein
VWTAATAVRGGAAGGRQQRRKGSLSLDGCGTSILLLFWVDSSNAFKCET